MAVTAHSKLKDGSLILVVQGATSRSLLKHQLRRLCAAQQFITAVTGMQTAEAKSSNSSNRLRALTIVHHHTVHIDLEPHSAPLNELGEL